MKIFILIFVVLILAGCASTHRMTTKEKCSYYGFTPGTDEYIFCVRDETHRFEDKLEKRFDKK